MRCSSEPVRDRIDPQGTHFSFLPPKQLAVSRLRLNDGLTVDDSRTGSHLLAAAERRRPRHGGTVQSIVVRGRHRGPDTGCSALVIAGPTPAAARSASRAVARAFPMTWCTPRAASPCLCRGSPRILFSPG